MKTHFLAALTVSTIAFFAPVQANAAEAVAVPKQEWSFSGPFGTYDRAAMQRGLKVYREVCAACHSLKRVYFRNLQDLGYTPDQVANIAAEYTVVDGPNDEGEMFDRQGRPSDAFVSPYANDKQAMAVNGGALPPDLSLITKARPNGSDYLYALITGYADAPEGEEVAEGKAWNKYFPGHVISMAPPLSDDMIMYEDGTDQTAEQYTKDVVQFLTWAADPYMEKRKQTGVAVIIFLVAFASVMYAVKRKIWSKIH